jgi:hypothetical protein
LVAVEVERHHERKHRRRIERLRVEHLDPHVDVAVLFDPKTVFAVKRMRLVA